MIAQKVIFIVPGYKQRVKQRAYKEIAKILKQEGYKSILVPIPWKKTTISDNTAHFLKKYSQVQTRKKYILGFSFGAMIAFLASTRVQTTGLILCSLSPYFQEDMVKMRKSVLSKLWQERYEDFSRLHSATLAKKIKAKQILIMYGAKEEKSLIKRVRKTYNYISTPRKYLVRIKETEHDIGNRRYLRTIREAAKSFS